MRIFIRPEPLHHLPLLVNKELGKVPLDEGAQSAALLALHVLPQGMSIIPIDIDLTGHVKLHIILLDELLDLRLRPRLLIRELVTWKSQN